MCFQHEDKGIFRYRKAQRLYFRKTQEMSKEAGAWSEAHQRGPEMLKME